MRDKVPSGYIKVNTTSRSEDFGKGLSPFLLRDIKLFDGTMSKNMENAWQYSKVYKVHTDEEGEPTKEYYTWARKGFNSTYADRYPMGKGVKPLYSIWDDEKLSYVEARKKIYLQLYARAVIKTKAFNKLKELYEEGQNIALIDFDGYDHRKLGMSYREVIESETNKFGHAFIVAMLLEGKLKRKKG